MQLNSSDQSFAQIVKYLFTKTQYFMEQYNSISYWQFAV